MEKLEKLIHWFSDKGTTMVALSGGVDSALVAYAAHKALGNSAIAVTADYKTLSQEELETAKIICNEIGIKQILINYNELENENFIQNDKTRCFHCRTELADHLLNLAKENNISTIVDGTNLSDLGDYRPGIQALHEKNIRSPLVETKYTKDDVRHDAKIAKLSVYDKPSNSCLASRIPWGQRVTAEKLMRIELGETFVKNTTNAKQVRVRDMDGIAKIEVEPENVQKISNQNTINQLNSQLQLIGFKSVVIDPEGYRPGKINVIVD